MDRPEPLWRPICEEADQELQSTSLEGSKSSASRAAQGNASPPSPRTLKAIQTAMNDSSDEEKVDQEKRGGSVSPRTLLAIQQALAEEEGGAVDVANPLPQVICSSEEETEPDDLKSLPGEKSDLKGSLTSQGLRLKDFTFVGSSEDEMEEVIGQRNKALRSAVLQQSHERQKSEDETKTEQLTESRGWTEKEEELGMGESEQRLITEKGREDLVQQQYGATSSQNTLSTSLPVGRENETHHLQPKSLEVLQQKKGSDVKTESSEESESEGT